MKHIAFRILLVGAFAAGGQAAEKPCLTLDAFFQLENITDGVFSPSGNEIAIVRSRSRAGQHEHFLSGRLNKHRRDDVWVAQADGSASRQLTFGGRDGSSFWDPTWSPDARQILVLSDRGLDNVHLELIDAKSGTMRRLSQRGIDLEADLMGPRGRADQIGIRFSPMLWLDEHRVLFAELAQGEVANALASGNRRISQIKDNWEKTENGREPSFSAIDAHKAKSPRPPGRLVIADLRTGEFTPIAEGVFRKVTVSPDGHYAAIILEGAPIEENETTTMIWQRGFWFAYPPTTMNFHTSFAILRLDGKRGISLFPTIKDPVIDSVPSGNSGTSVLGTLYPQATYFGPVWFNHKPAVALFAQRTDGNKGRDGLFVVDAESGAAREIPHPGIAAFNLGVVSDRIFVRGGGEKESRFSIHAPYHWYAVDGGPLRINDRAQDAADAEYLVDLSDGDGLAIDPKTGAWSLWGKGTWLSNGSDERLKGAKVLWPNGHYMPGRDFSAVLVQSADSTLTVIHPAKDSITLTPSWSVPSETLFSFNPKAEAVTVVSRSLSKGTDLYVASRQAGTLNLQSLNHFLQQFYDPKYVDFHYANGEGHSRVARLFLPPSYRQGDLLPVITHVYITQKPSSEIDIYPPEFYMNMDLALGYGFGVLFPSINSEPEDRGRGSPYSSLKRDVVPAVLAAETAKIADPARTYLVGYSYGGYSTYALSEQTDVFAAAAAINGPTDLVTAYVDTDQNNTYYPWAFENHQSLQGEFEFLQGEMGLHATPWGDYDRYVENSPLRHADRADTPLLLVSSDSDIFSMHQADNMFGAMMRLGKEARYLRVWGEDHAFDSPANIRLLWEQMTQWFLSHRRTNLPTASAPPQNNSRLTGRDSRPRIPE